MVLTKKIDKYNSEIFDLMSYLVNNKKTEFGRVDKTFITALRNIESEVVLENLKLQRVNLVLEIGVFYSINDLFHALDSSERDDVLHNIERAVFNNAFDVLMNYKK